MTEPLRTPDGKYIVVRERLWRASNPNLPEHERSRLVSELMDARRRVRTKDAHEKAIARIAVDKAKHDLGERGEVWWTDGEPDYNRYLIKNTPYAAWYAKGVGAHEH